MERLSLIVSDVSFEASLIRLEPAGEGRVEAEVVVGAKLNRGESCNLKNPHGRAMECVVSQVEPSGTSYAVTMRCLADAEFEAIQTTEPPEKEAS